MEKSLLNSFRWAHRAYVGDKRVATAVELKARPQVLQVYPEKKIFTCLKDWKESVKKSEGLTFKEHFHGI